MDELTNVLEKVIMPAIMPIHGIEATTEYVRDHVTYNLERGHVCVDGRNKPTDAGKLARLGASFGYTNALLAKDRERRLPYPPELIADRTYRTIVKLADDYGLHGDTHNEQLNPWQAISNRNLGLIGCAAVSLATDELISQMMVLDRRDVITALSYLHSLPSLRYDVLVNFHGLTPVALV